MRLIDADALIVDDKTCNEIRCTDCKMYVHRCEDFLDIIKNAPTIEPDWNELMVICDNCGHAITVKRTDAKPTIEERKKGKWLPDNNYYEERFICSVCGKSYKVDTCMGKPMWDFCPCGADMRGET